MDSLGSVSISSGTQHSGKETNLISFHITLLHHRMITGGLPYSEACQNKVDEITGGSPYGMTTIAALDRNRMRSENELVMAQFQGMHVTSIARKLTGG